MSQLLKTSYHALLANISHIEYNDLISHTNVKIKTELKIKEKF